MKTLIVPSPEEAAGFSLFYSHLPRGKIVVNNKRTSENIAMLIYSADCYIDRKYVHKYFRLNANILHHITDKVYSLICVLKKSEIEFISTRSRTKDIKATGRY